MLPAVRGLGGGSRGPDIGLGILALIALLLMLYFGISIFFRIKFVLNKLGEKAWLWWIVLFLLTPILLGFLIIPLIVICKANKALSLSK